MKVGNENVMDLKRVTISFAQIGASIDIVDRGAGLRSSEAMRAPLRVDQQGREGRFVINVSRYVDPWVAVLDVDTAKVRPSLLLSIDPGDQPAERRHGARLYLCGRENDRWYVRPVPPFRHVRSVVEARAVLRLIGVDPRAAALQRRMPRVKLPGGGGQSKVTQTVVSKAGRYGRQRKARAPLANLNGWLI